MSVKMKAWILITLILIAMLGIMITGLLTLRVTSDSDNRARVEQLLTSTWSTVVQIERFVQQGKLDIETARELATQILRENKYSQSEYVYVADDQMNFVATPLDPQLHGTSFHDFKDGDGNSVGRILLTAVSKNPQGTAWYEWSQKKEDGSIEEKLSIARKTPVWGWYVGTGIGFNEVNARFWSTAQWQVVICIVVSGILAALLLYSIRRLLRLLGAEPKVVRKILQTLASGDLSSPEHLPSDISRNSVLDSALSLRRELAEIVQSLSGTVSELRAETQSSGQRINTIFQNFEIQKQETDMVASAMMQMATSSQTVSQRASHAADETQTAETEGTKAEDVICVTVESIETLVDQIHQASETINNLGQDVNNIVSVLEVIRGIAEQTNLLALNAAIEAARAGESGRGFAVVADEVRALAARTQESTEEIQQMIENLQSGSSKAIQAINVSKDASQGTVEQVRQADDALKNIATALSTISEMNHHIAAAANEQNQVADDISQRINRIASSSSEASELVAKGREVAARIVHQSDKLDTIVNHFTLK